MIGVIDYGAGNIASVRNALSYIGQASTLITTPDSIRLADAIVFPGQGSFGSMVDNLEGKALYRPLREELEAGKPFLGICLGLQLLFDGSDESPGYEGYGLMKGTCTKFTEGKVPQIGWNKIEPETPTFPEGWAYYVNSYRIESSDCAIATSDYHGRFVAAVQNGALTAFQFHPEKSGPYGLSLLRWWISCWQNE